MQAAKRTECFGETWEKWTACNYSILRIKTLAFKFISIHTTVCPSLPAYYMARTVINAQLKDCT